MPKKSTKHVIDSGNIRSHGRTTLRPPTTTAASKHCRTIQIGVTNGKRWTLLKRRLNLTTDAELAAHLLDLAETSIRKSKGCMNVVEWKADRNDKGRDTEGVTVLVAKAHEMEEPLRRSPRKQLPASALEVPLAVKEAAEVAESVVKSKETEKPGCPHGLRNKHRKSKTKHHKTKRKKRRRPKSSEVNCVLAKSSVDETEFNSATEEERTMSVENSDEADSKQQSSRPRVSVELIKPKTEDINRVELNYVKRVDNEVQSTTNPCNETTEIEVSSVGNEADVDAGATSVESDSMTLRVTASSRADRPPDEHSMVRRDPTPEISDNDQLESSPTNPTEMGRKIRKKRKKIHCDTEESKKCSKNGSDNPSEEHTHKHRRKKHKHVGEHKYKKHHDVRKAPQNGLVTVKIVPVETVENERLPCPVAVDETEAENCLGEPQRLAIKITLCQECNSRHLQDACPLSDPQYVITDSISYENWLNEHRSNAEVGNASNCKDPMSGGYDRPNDDGFDSDDDQTSCEQPKPRVKMENEEKMLIIDKDRPVYARDSLPDCLELKETSHNHGFGIYAKSELPIYARLGPLVGISIKEMDIPDDFPMRHIWEIDQDGKTSYVSTTNPLRSNWIRYTRPADSKDERNALVVIRDEKLYLVTTRNIAPGTELTYWAVNSQSSNWTRKNKTDKTNCGGCNLNFAHPIYYRLHCCIFHDTNYSLTIRKYHCKICGAAVLGKDNIMKHAAELHAGRGAYQCQYCKKFFLRLNYLEMHRTYGCAQNPQRARPLCDFCGRKFCQPQKLKVHIKRMHNDMSEVLREFQCKLCLKLLGSRAALQRHMKEVHHKDVVGAATCDRCGKMFQNKSNLKIHMLTHSGVKPFRCKENTCKAAFTTKQCLQFHYKKVHGLTEEMMPKIERSVAYTFDAYSGGLMEDSGRGKSPQPNRIGSQDNSNSSPSLDDCSSESDPKAEISTKFNVPEGVEVRDSESSPAKDETEPDRDRSPSPQLSICNAVTSSVDGGSTESVQTEADLYATSRLQSKGSKKWMGEFNPPSTTEVLLSQQCSVPPDVYGFEERKEDEKITRALMDDSKLGMSVYRRTESSNASLLVEAALDAAERDIGAVSSPMLEDSDRDTNLYSISTHLESPMPQRTPEAHLDYIQQQELASPAQTPDSRHTPPSHLHLDYHLHRPVEYINARTHNMEQYLHHEELPRDSSPSSYIHVQGLVPSEVAPNSRYQDMHHHQVPTDNLSSDEGDSVAQNLSLPIKEKALQLDLSTSYKYEAMESEFGRERTTFEPLLLNSTELQGLDMSARGFHHSFGPQVQNARYHHHLYEINDRQSVDLSRTGGYSMPSPPSAPPYPHSEVLRVVSLDLTHGGRHSVDLTMPRSHHLHGTGSRVITSPQPPTVSTPHVVPDTVEGRILSPPPPGYNPTYPLSPAPYHPPRPGYHHYSGYY